MICTADEGFLDDQGNVKVRESPFLTGCSKEKRGPTFLDYEESYQEVVIDSTRKKLSDSFNGTVRNKTVTKLRRRRIPRRRTRRQYGICQNDHGGPLTTWVGNSEILVGVATMFRVNRSSWNACIGPHLFTSTLCNGEFIDCTLSNKTSRRSVCDAPAIMRGYHVIENYVHWTTDRESDDENDTHTVIEQFVDGVKTPYKPLEPTLLPVLDLYHENSSDTLPAI
ncbi:uncharacterized protein LOC111357338 [Spodoptera litura]|uniref:Uncharacterized protein LOC111357338 n=1 Tax=Spodoptera litura TaxID=69820 RepID=A0A9J7IUK9_SPOLT|nr:uncharacterized protein LOC111357338 [Spodoptera litura]